MSDTPLTPELTVEPAGWPDKFLTALASTGNVSMAAKKAAVTRQGAYARRAADPEFAARWQDAMDQAADWLEAEARRRAVTGVRRPVYQNGKLVGHVKEYSDALLTLLLKAARPDRYRENSKVVMAGDPAGHPVQIDVTARALPDADAVREYLRDLGIQCPDGVRPDGGG